MSTEKPEALESVLNIFSEFAFRFPLTYHFLEVVKVEDQMPIKAARSNYYHTDGLECGGLGKPLSRVLPALVEKIDD